MAKSLIGGAFGMLRGSIGSVTYTTSTAALDGKRRQVARQKVTEVRNPNTLAQILQRMKVGPAARFYTAFENAVPNGIMSHSFEGVEYGNKSRLRFMQLAQQGDPKVYVPKGINYFVPGEFQVSEGSLPEIPINGTYGEGGFAFVEGRSMSEDIVAALLNSGYQLGDQLTLLNVYYTNGRYEPHVGRVIIGVGNQPEVTTDMDLCGLMDGVNGIQLSLGRSTGALAAVAIIVSRGTNPATAQRSTAVMQLVGDYKNLLSAEAMEAAIASYKDNVTYNSFNSDWYLNNGTSQAFNGRVSFVDAVVSGAGELETDDSFLVGQRINGSAVSFVVMTTDGTAAGQVFVVANGACRPATFADQDNTPVTGEQLRAGLLAAGASVSTDYVKVTPEIAAQGGFTLTT